MKTPPRLIRIDDKLWDKAKKVAESEAKETGYSVTASDIVRKALREFLERMRKPQA
jgi:hypothetical protein